MASVARGQAPTALSLEPGLFAVTTVLAARGYPDVPVKGAEITIPESLPPGVTVFHAGTARDEDGTLRVAGGRVLNVTAVASSFDEAQARAERPPRRLSSRESLPPRHRLEGGGATDFPRVTRVLP